MREAFSEALDTQVATKGDIAALKTDIARIEREITVVKWMIGLVIAVNVIPFLKSFF